MSEITKRITSKHGSVRAYCEAEGLNYEVARQVLCGTSSSLLIQISLVQNGFASVDEIRDLRTLKDDSGVCHAS